MIRDAKRWALHRRISFRYWFYRRPVATLVVIATIILVVQILLMAFLDYDNQTIKSSKQSSYDNKVAKVIHKNKVRVASTGGLGKILGVQKDKQSLYLPVDKQWFKCIHSDQYIKFDRLNDNYCDCDDHSDEPSTSACTDSTFHCTQGGMVIPSSRVNDGVCDCCDGADEYLNLNIIKSNDQLLQADISDIQHHSCPNICLRH